MGLQKKILLGVLTLVLLAFCIIGGRLYYQATHPASPTQAASVIIEVKPGMTMKQLVVRLAQHKLIQNAIAFRLLAYFEKKQNQIQVGEYALSPSMLPRDILDKIRTGLTIKYPVTIPEGHRITEIAHLLAQNGLADRDRFIQLAQDSEVIKSLDIRASTLEGYLFPETYHFSKTTGERAIIKAMVDIFKKRVITPENIQRLDELNFDLNQAVTLASLIEKETGLERERQMVSSVFHNRLKKNMRLQTDPSVIYALADFDGNIRKKDLSIDSPYNTYKYAGLPPGPIANPGLKSIQAALYPADTNYLYFVSRNDGSHRFTTNLDDHNHAVAEFQLKKPGRS